MVWWPMWAQRGGCGVLVVARMRPCECFVGGRRVWGCLGHVDCSLVMLLDGGRVLLTGLLTAAAAPAACLAWMYVSGCTCGPCCCCLYRLLTARACCVAANCLPLARHFQRLALRTCLTAARARLSSCLHQRRVRACRPCIVACRRAGRFGRCGFDAACACMRSMVPASERCNQAFFRAPRQLQRACCPCCFD